MKLIASKLRARGTTLPPLDLVAEPGQSIALLGDALAGTLLATLAGRLPPAAGVVHVDGAHATAARSRVAYVGPGTPAFPAGLRVAELAALEGTAIEPRLGPFSLAPLARARTDALTRPQARAVALALALTSASRVVLLDEPTLDVAPESSAALRAALRDPRRAVLFSTRSRELAQLADRLLHAGAPREARLTVQVGRGLPELAAELARQARGLHGQGFHLEQHEGTLWLHTVDPTSAARAVARAALVTQAEIHALHTELP